MTATVLVGMSIVEANQHELLRRRAAERGATVAYLQHGEPSLVAELTRLADQGVTAIRLEAGFLGARSPGRSWLRRVAGHWLRGAEARPRILVDDSPVTGEEAGMTSPAWEEVPGHSQQILVCRGPRCSAAGAQDTSAEIDATLKRMGLGDDDVLVTQTGCLFPCNQAPVVVIHPDDAWFGHVDAHAARRLVVERIQWGLPVTDHLLPRRRHQI
jgi:(2Fe-2S) ferredoxin